MRVMVMMKGKQATLGSYPSGFQTYAPDCGNPM